MESRSNQQNLASTPFTCDCCDGPRDERRVPRRDFLLTAGGAVLGAGAMVAGLPTGRIWAQAKDAIGTSAITDGAIVKATTEAAPETLVKVLYEALSPKQRETICFAWDHVEKERGLLRTRVENNWDVTDKYINSDFYTKDQRAIIRGIFEGIINPEWHERIDKQLKDDSDGYGEQNSIAIFGTPGEKFEFVMTGRHMTIRCDGNSAEHVAFGGPIFYGHAADGFDEGPTHPGNVFWPQAEAANKLYQMLDGKQQQQALVRDILPKEQSVGFRKKDEFLGLPASELSSDQKDHLQQVLNLLTAPYRQSDGEEFAQCLKAQGGLEACNLAYFAKEDIGEDGVWDIWRLEGPSFVWHYRGAPHVHVWVNVADDPGVKLNA